MLVTFIYNHEVEHAVPNEEDGAKGISEVYLITQVNGNMQSDTTDSHFRVTLKLPMRSTNPLMFRCDTSFNSNKQAFCGAEAKTTAYLLIYFWNNRQISQWHLIAEPYRFTQTILHCNLDCLTGCLKKIVGFPRQSIRNGGLA